MIDIVNAFVGKYDSVALINGRVKESFRKLDNTVILSKITPYNRKSMITRCISWIFATLQISFLLLLKYRDYHVIYVTNPPMSYWTSLIVKNTYSIIVYDIYPDALRNLNISTSNIIFRLWEKINCRIFKGAKQLYTLSDGMVTLLSKYCDPNKLVVIPNWSVCDDLKPLQKDKNPFVIKHQLEHKFVVMYSGNIGYTHNVETILDIAKKMKNDQDICFYIIGEGLKKKTLMDIADKEQLSNCYFLPYQPIDQIRYSIAAADLSVITLTEETAFVSVPSKTYNLLAVGSPILVIAPSKSEIEIIINKEKCGMAFDKDNIDGMLSYILHLKNDLKYKMELSNNSYSASSKYEYKNARIYADYECTQ